MKVLFASYRNPAFPTITEYFERALADAGCTVQFVSDRDFVLPGRLRNKVGFLQRWDLRRMNRSIVAAAERFRPDLFLEGGGHRVSRDTVEWIRRQGARTALWTTDPVQEQDHFAVAAASYEFVFCSGTEAVDLLRTRGVAARLLPYACDPRMHHPLDLSDAERSAWTCDVAFVGSVDPALYPFRVQTLESIVDLNLSVWGPGTDRLSPRSPLRPHVRGGSLRPEDWRRVYAGAKVVLCMHYRDPRGLQPCHQASPRIFEAMACGAFLMTDAQRDVMAMFEDGRDLVVFRNVEELRGRLAEFLSNPASRHRIAETGRGAALAKHTYAHRIREILDAMKS